jgi:hypothetical protein
LAGFGLVWAIYGPVCVVYVSDIDLWVIGGLEIIVLDCWLFINGLWGWVGCDGQ